MQQYSLTTFQEYMNALDVQLTMEQYEQFIQYYELLTKWNSFMNLTAITDYEEVVLKHFVDSLSLVKVSLNGLLNRQLKIIDIGTGAGFPGIPLKIAFPHLKVTLLDSLNKRVTFLNEVIVQLGLTDIIALHGRAEEYAKPEALRESFDICVSRAVAKLSVLAEYCIPYVKRGGYFIAYKSEKTESELAEAEHALSVLGGQITSKTEFYLPGSDIYRNLITVKKVSSTPKKYPRKAGLPAREPL